jgi:glycosyltransferase involved in cell wall biosynthesis
MAMNVPVIATDVGGTGELVVDGLTGRLVPAGDTSALADFMVAAKRKPEESARMAEDARSMVEERFSMKRRVARIEEIYREAAAR